MINIISSSRYKIARKSIKDVASGFLSEHGFSEGHDINIIFAGKNKLKIIAKKYKHENLALPVLTFVYNESDEGKKYLGEVFICYPQAVIMAAQKGKKVDEIIEKLVLHGLDNIIKNV